jgi:hypothetical protein
LEIAVRLKPLLFILQAMSKSPWLLGRFLFGTALLLVVMLASRPCKGDALVSLETPLGFFTNIASRLLRSELGIDLARIDLYPTNRYSPSVHRLLQFQARFIPEPAYEALPSQLLPSLRRDSILDVALKNERAQLRVSGLEGHTYAVQVSTNLADWTSIGTNTVEEGFYEWTDAEPRVKRFYRSVLLHP